MFLYVRPDYFTQLEPKLTGWFAHKDPFAFEVDDIVYRDDVYRFMNGTHAVPNLYAIGPGVDIIAQVGVDNIRAKSKRQTAYLWALAEKAGFKVNSPKNPDERAGTLTIDPSNAYEVSRELVARNIVVDYREDAGIRVSPHFYNSDEELELVIFEMKEILVDGGWVRHSTGRVFVT